jgi:multidrug efflux pump
MKFTDFFIKHPVITIVINFMIMAVGFLCFDGLHLREYPKVEAPVLSVVTNYPNANSDLVENEITNPLEEQLTGIENLEKIESWTKNGQSYITITFKEEVIMDTGMVLVRDAIAIAKDSLPKSIKEPVIIKQGKGGSGFPFLGIALSSPSRDFGDLTHYAQLFLKNAFKGVNGVAWVATEGRSYTMDVELDPKKMYALGINGVDVLKAISKRTETFPVGKFQDKNSTFLENHLSSVKDFESVFLIEKNGKPIFLNSVAKISLNTSKQGNRMRINKKPGLILWISPSSDSNPLDVAKGIHEKVQLIKESLPKDMKLEVILDQSEFIKTSLSNLKSSILEATILVLVVVFVFLRNLRATLIPLVTIPISLIGGIIFLKIFGFSINTMTLLSMVLAIGLVVDDAIVVLENITRHIEEGLSPLDAAFKGSREISFAVIAMTCTLASVYIPLAFLQGVIGQLLSEFAIALAGSVILSGIVALTLSPLMCSKLPPIKQEKSFPKIDVFLNKIDIFYEKSLSFIFTHHKRSMLIMPGLLIFMSILFIFIPKEPAPKEDRGIVGVYTRFMPGKNLEQLEEKIIQIEEKLLPFKDQTQNMISSTAIWGGQIYLCLKNHRNRNKTPAQIVDEITPEIEKFPSIDIWPWSLDTGLPSSGESGNMNDVDVVISTSKSYPELFDYLDMLKYKLKKKKIFKKVSHNLNLDDMGYKITINDPVASLLGISTEQITKTIEIFFGGNQNLNFQKDNFSYPITVKGTHYPWDLDALYVINSKGKKISIGTLASMTQTNLPTRIEHYNQMRSAYFTATLAKGDSFEKGVEILKSEIDKTLPEGFKREFSGGSKTYEKISKAIFFLIGLSILFIYAILAMQFECFLSPLIVMTTVPFAGFGALLFLMIFGQSMNLYSLIGMITLIGLITKHGILIVDFANKLSVDLSLEQAVKKAAQLRLRPILMTTSAMILGSVPLIFSTGAGSEARFVIGLTIIGGLGIGTIFTIFILPGIYISLNKIKRLIKI